MVPSNPGWGVPHQRSVAAFERPVATVIGELGRKYLMSAVGLGNDHEAGRVLVKAVDDTWPGDAADTGEAIPAMGDEGIDQRAGTGSGAGMDDEAGRLVDNDQGIVFMDDGQRDPLGRWRGRFRRRQRDRQMLTRFDRSFRLHYRRAADRDVAIQDKSLRPRAAHIGDGCGEIGVETRPRLGRRHDQFDTFETFSTHGQPGQQRRRGKAA